MVDRLDKSDIYERFAEVTRQTKDLVESMEVLSEKLSLVLAENAKLAIENDHLHEVIKQQHREQKKEGLSDSRKMLQRLYQEGFHVCNDMYGKRLEKNEACTFCLDAIYGRHQVKWGEECNKYEVFKQVILEPFISFQRQSEIWAIWPFGPLMSSRRWI